VDLVAPVAIVSNIVLQRKLLTPFREQTGGTVLVSLYVCLCVCVCERESLILMMYYNYIEYYRQAS